MKKSEITCTVYIPDAESGEAERNCRVQYTYSAVRPAVMYLRNGDPGYPEEPAEVEIWSVVDSQYGIEYLSILSDEEYSRLQDKIFEAEEE